MGRINVKAAAVFNARPEDVYAAIADYRNGHPNIVPKESIYDLQVEQGGYGEGTVIRFKVKALGTELTFHQRVSEPEPGRVLVEQDIDSPENATTTFTVNPVGQGQQAHVEIATTMNPSPGLQGIVQRLLVSLINPPVYRKELKLLMILLKRLLHIIPGEANAFIWCLWGGNQLCSYTGPAFGRTQSLPETCQSLIKMR